MADPLTGAAGFEGRSRDTYKGLKVLELASVIAGPYATMILGDLGAEVIKVENPVGGDDARAMPPHVDGQSTLFLAMNRGKRSVAVDLKESSGRAAVQELAADADVIVQSFRPGVAERLGLGFEELSASNSKLVYCSISAFGESAAGEGLPGYDPLIQAFVGLMSMTGEPDGGPSRVAASIIDLSTGMWAAMAIMAALSRRATEERPQKVEATLLDSGYTLLSHQIVSMIASGVVPGRLGSASTIAVPYEAFETTDGWIMITAGNDSMFRRMCEAIDLPGLAAEDSPYVDSLGRVEGRLTLHHLLQARFSEHPSDVWIERLEGARVPVAPIQDLAEAVDHPMVADRALLIGSAGRPDLPPTVRLPIDDSRPVAFQPAPRLGADTTEILEEAGIDPRSIGDPDGPGAEADG
jgi:crotonobetainyl-CoA:carnitine CoA-transferase CaiB-like acyl-CoA transferase